MIRPAWPSDVPAIVEMLREYHTVLPRPPEPPPFVAEDCATFLTARIRDEIAFVQDDGVAIHGIVLGSMGETFYNRSCRVGTLEIWYVEPLWRDGTGARLLAHFEDGAVSRGANMLVAGFIARRRDDAMDRLLRAKGYVLSDMYYLKEAA